MRVTTFADCLLTPTGPERKGWVVRCPLDRQAGMVRVSLKKRVRVATSSVPPVPAKKRGGKVFGWEKKSPFFRRGWAASFFLV